MNLSFPSWENKVSECGFTFFRYNGMKSEQEVGNFSQVILTGLQKYALLDLKLVFKLFTGRINWLILSGN